MWRRIISIGMTAVLLLGGLGASKRILAEELPEKTGQEADIMPERGTETGTAWYQTEAGQEETSENATEIYESEVAEIEEDGMEVVTIYAAETGAAAFVERLYTLTLGRTSEPAGKAYWINRVTAGQVSGSELAAGFVFSDEYKKKNTSNADYAEMLYKTILNRNSDADGKTYWIKNLENGVSRKGVFAGFTNSTEFRNLCKSYGINAGSWSSDEARDGNYQATAFIQRLYQNILGRSADVDGLNHWCQRLKNGEAGAAVAAGFVLSSEYQKKNTGNSEYVEMLYKTVLNRNSDASGKAYWIRGLENGVSRSGVLAGFTNSAEFKRLCGNYGINAGSWSSDEARDVNYNATVFVQRLYKTILGRTADTSGLNYWCQKLREGIGGAEIAASFLLSGEFKSKQISLDDYIALLYNAFLGREPDAPELQYWVNQVRSGAHTAGTIVNEFAGSEEFKMLCNGYGINTGTVDVSGSLPNVVTDGSFVHQATATTPALCREMLELVNQARIGAEKTPDIWGDAELEAYALQRAKELQIAYSHDRPDGSARMCSEVISKAVSNGSRITPQIIFDRWMASVAHKGTILSGSADKQYSMVCAYIGDKNGTQYWIIVWK